MKEAWQARLVRALIALCTTILSGCGVFTPPAVQPRLGLLNELPAELAAREAPPRRAATILVGAPQTQRAYDTTQMAYMLREHEIAYYRDHEWGATPSEMLQPLLVSTLQRTRAFSAVLAAPSIGPTTHVLQAHVGALVQDFTGPTAVVRLSLHVQLSDQLSHRASSREFLVDEAMARAGPEAGVDAANRAVAKALQNVARFVLESTAAD